MAVNQSSTEMSDWDPYMVMVAIKKTGISLSKLSELHGFSRFTLYKALRADSFLKYEEIIAKFLGLTVEDIWPTRVAKRHQKKQLKIEAIKLALDQAKDF